MAPTTSYYAVGPKQIVTQIVITELQYRAIVTGEALSRFDVVYQDGSQVSRARANNTNTMDGIGMAETDISSGVPGNIVIRGRLVNTAWSLTSGGFIYVSPATAGAITQTIPILSGQVVQRLGMALTTTSLELNPEAGFTVAE